jgi:hypothetical protein
MLLTDIAIALRDLLNLSPEKWSAQAGIEARLTLDWVTCLQKTSLQVLIVPEMVQYNLEQSDRRRRFTNVQATKFITIMVGKGFESLPTNDDVTPWEESKELLDVRERITQFVIANPLPGLALIDIEEIPIDELELNHRNFIAVNQLGYQVIQCGSAPDLLSS